jgi:hypothetical protein
MIAQVIKYEVVIFLGAQDAREVVTTEFAIYSQNYQVQVCGRQEILMITLVEYDYESII